MYIGSFNSDAPIDSTKNPHCVELFEKEQEQLLHDLYEIPSRSCDRKVRSWCSAIVASLQGFKVTCENGVIEPALL